LEREYDMDLITTAPTVVYELLLKDGEVVQIENPSRLPETSRIAETREPVINVNLLMPQDYVGAVMTLCNNKRGIQKNMQYMGRQVMLSYEMPLNEVVLDFFDKLKSEGLYDDSLILVYGDHTPVLPAFSAGTINYDPNSVQEKEVPLTIKLPNETVGETHPEQGTHLDIMPTILDLLGIKTNQLMFGQSLFAEGKNALKVCSDQMVAFQSSINCNDMLTIEKNKSSTIIRYNQFKNLPK